MGFDSSFFSPWSWVRVDTGRYVAVWRFSMFSLLPAGPPGGRVLWWMQPIESFGKRVFLVVPCACWGSLALRIANEGGGGSVVR